ncbi:hypothetical protein JTB14_029039 [Gonioctena quinquepunctata]|nr:hypothetical protein JTB14_029039 [Gonioctena quinquepunctata]
MKKETEQKKLERKQARELNKLKKEQEKAEKQKGKKSKRVEESGSSGDDVELTDSPEEIEMLKADVLKLGTFVLVKFEMLGKRNASTYRCINTEKTAFYKIENDISTIIGSDILGKLPDPIIEERLFFLEGWKFSRKYYVMQFVLPFVKTGIALQASNSQERNTMLLDEETETVGEPTLQEDTEVASTEASDYQPNNPLFQTEQTNIGSNRNKSSFS